MKASVRSIIRRMPRMPHKHNFSEPVKKSGSKVRYGCDSCPYVDPRRYRDMSRPNIPALIEEHKYQPMSFGFPQKREAFPYEHEIRLPMSTKSVVRSDYFGVTEIPLTDFIDTKDIEIDPKTVRTLLDGDWNVSETADLAPGVSLVKPTFSEDNLNQLGKKQLQTIAVTMDVKHNTKTTKAELIAGILSAQEEEK